MYSANTSGCNTLLVEMWAHLNGLLLPPKKQSKKMLFPSTFSPSSLVQSWLSPPFPPSPMFLHLSAKKSPSHTRRFTTKRALELGHVLFLYGWTTGTDVMDSCQTSAGLNPLTLQRWSPHPAPGVWLLLMWRSHQRRIWEQCLSIHVQRPLNLQSRVPGQLPEPG